MVFNISMLSSTLTRGLIWLNQPVHPDSPHPDLGYTSRYRLRAVEIIRYTLMIPRHIFVVCVNGLQHMVELMASAETSSPVSEGRVCFPDPACGISSTCQVINYTEQNDGKQCAGSANLSSDRGAWMDCIHTVSMTMLSHGMTPLASGRSRVEGPYLSGSPTLLAELQLQVIARLRLGSWTGKL